MSKNRLVLLAAALLFALPSVSLAQETKRAITQIAGDLYRFQNNFHFSVFLVTPDGVIATDPINAEAAEWLKAEIKSRFNQPIRYVVYSHDHGDHVSGGEVFKQDGATIIAHAVTGSDLAAGDVATAAPDITYTDRMTLTLGGKSVELMFLGNSHSDNMTVMHFPDERAVFTVDFISVRRLPFRTLRDGFWPDWPETIDRVAALDFDILVPGHGPMGNQQDAIDHAQYLRDLAAAVKSATDAGQTLDQMKASIRMEKYADWVQYDSWLAENIEGMHRLVTQ